jgi:anti-sigma factor RsiW
MRCQDAKPLVPSYLDGELSEAQAAPLRRHLLGCQPCRAEAQADKNLRRWFVATPAVTVPDGFAARVAQLAFAGAAERYGAETEPAPFAQEVERETPILRFVLRLTAVAAALALFLSVAIRSLELPSSTELRADDRPVMSLDEALEKLDDLERRERADPASIQRPVQDPGQDSQPAPAAPRRP